MLDDEPSSAVPITARRGPVTMGLLWITMVTAFPTVLIGFQWYREGLSFEQVLVCAPLACLLLLAYAVPVTYLGAVSGQTYGMLSRRALGRHGSRFVTVVLEIVFLGWYGLGAVLLAEAIESLLHLGLPTPWVAAALALLMALNNAFGFVGVANFARFLAAPVLIAWVGYTFAKTVAAASPIFSTATLPWSSAFVSVASFVVGFSAWGNEADYWSHSKPKLLYAVLPQVAALAVGQVTFPITGWMVAARTGIGEYGAATAFMNDYSFAGMSGVAVAVLAISYFAANDANMFGSVSALANLIKLPRLLAVAIIAFLGAGMAAWISLSGAAAAIESIAILNAILLPLPAVLATVDHLVLARLLGEEHDLSRVTRMAEVQAVRWPGLAALVTGYAVGIATSGLIPGTRSLQLGLCFVNAWVVALLLLVILRFREARARRMPAAERAAG